MRARTSSTRRSGSRRVRTPIALAIAATLATALAPAVARGAETPGPWTPYPGPEPVTGRNAVNDVRAVSDSLAWAVGVAGNGHSLLKWDGVAWNGAEVTPAPTGRSGLTAVHAVSATSAWAVGWSGSGPWVLRFRDGAWKGFSVTGLPGGRLAGVATTATGMPVVVSSGGYSSRAKVAKWNGTSWVVGSLPIRGTDSPSSRATAIRYVPGTGDAFVVVGAESGTNAAWAVRGRPGRTWQNFSPPPTVKPPTGPSFVFTSDFASDVQVTAGGDITLVGVTATFTDIAGAPPGQRPLVTRWNGSTWVRQKFATIAGDEINAIVVQPGKSRLLVGYNNESFRGIAYEYTPASGWQRLPSRPEGTSLYGAGAVPGTSGFWGVGSQGAVVESDGGFPLYSYSEDAAYLLRR